MGLFMRFMLRACLFAAAFAQLWFGRHERPVKSVRQINSWPKVHENAILFSKNTETHTHTYIQCMVDIPPQLQLQLHQRQQLQSAARAGLTSALEEDVVQSAVK